MTTTSRAGDCTSAGRVSGAGMTGWMAGSQCIRRYWHATECGRGHESHESFMEHVSLLMSQTKDFVLRVMTTLRCPEGCKGCRHIRVSGCYPLHLGAVFNEQFAQIPIGHQTRLIINIIF
jgi:hypothetical protein